MAELPSVEVMRNKQAIEETLKQYCRGVDRRDAKLLETVYWPEATDDHIEYVGDPAGYIEFALKYNTDVRTSHSLCNILIELTGETTATAETYVLAYHDLPSEHGRRDWILGARYLDAFEKRGNDWRIIHRIVAVDFEQTMPATADWDAGFLAAAKKRDLRGGSFPSDPFYRFLSK